MGSVFSFRVPSREIEREGSGRVGVSWVPPTPRVQTHRDRRSGGHLEAPEDDTGALHMRESAWHGVREALGTQGGVSAPPTEALIK
jgi:hypothetical protein